MRGCFRKGLRQLRGCSVLPAYAGMFPSIRPSTASGSSSPRVCGDVSSSILPMKWRCRFSPRMRGCFSVGLSLGDVTIVLPAYAGMFLRKPRQHRCQRGFSPRMRGCFPRVLRWGPPALSSPRVCGDVSPQCAAGMRIAAFSPRMRGCFYTRVTPCSAAEVLPAYAGMFLWLAIASIVFIGSPCVCGDVSFLKR